MPVLTVTDLEVINRPGSRVVPRRYSIDGISFTVQAEELVLIAGGPAAGKDTLSQAILGNVPGVVVADGYELAALPKSPLTDGFFPNKIYIKNGFLTRDYPRQDDPTQLTDPDAPVHWDLFQRVRTAHATLLAFAEIDKLTSDKVDEFSRRIVIDEGRIVADTNEASFKSRLEQWVNEFARERYVYLKPNCKVLWDRFQLNVLTDWLG